MYRKARAFNIPTQDVPDLSDPNRQRRTTIEAEYLSLLLTWRLNSGTLSRTEIAQAYYWLRDRPRLTTFVSTQRPGTRLGLDPSQPDGLKPVAHLTGAAEVFLFDSTVLAESLSGTLKRLEERQRSPASETEGRRLRQQIELVGYLIAQWVVNGFAERAERKIVDRRVEAVGGWSEIVAKLRLLNSMPKDAGRVDHRLPSAPRQPAGGFSNSGIRRGWDSDEAANRGAGLWVVRDESASGCRVVSPATKGAGLRVGDAVALHDPLTDQWDVALVRRWKLAGEDRVELGMMWLGRNANPLEMFAVRGQGRDETVRRIDVLGGEPLGANGQFLLALLPSAVCTAPHPTFERAVAHGKSIWQIDNIELPGTDWCWAKLRIIGDEPGVAGERAAQPQMDAITEIEITAPKE